MAFKHVHDLAVSVLAKAEKRAATLKRADEIGGASPGSETDDAPIAQAAEGQTASNENGKEAGAVEAPASMHREVQRRTIGAVQATTVTGHRMVTVLPISRCVPSARSRQEERPRVPALGTHLVMVEAHTASG